MKSYPVSVPRHSYRGADRKKQAKSYEINRVATRVENYLNGDLARLPEDEIKVYLSYYVAQELNENPEIVKSLITGMDGGSNGVTIVKGSFERAMAKHSAPPDKYERKR